ncbi:cobalamin-binding protein [Halococcus sp. IIIV-5B]|uniref:cobalamin-binding protein n=1 Tax=Halococcus sp. IIIV-5B TaxID=2321230 RepID=UPI000E746C69|nr:cobalamin-binding protein [Halococcus sp. IIIV-5B]RJT03822.1 cobalamin-binding protein [Halococcus sp. IIIV-5B]
MRVVSLLPSATEIVFALGVEPVGVSHECDYPPAATEKPAVNRSRVDAEASSAEIDRQVLEAEEGEGVYDIDLATLDRLDPDLVVSQGICDVCAVDSVLVREAIDRLDLDCEVLTTDPHSLGDVFSDIRRVGRAVDREERADDLVESLEARVAAVEATTGSVERRPRVAVLDWIDPVMTAGHWVPEMVDLAGGSEGFTEPGGASRPREWDATREYDPEVLVVAPCGFDLHQTAENLADLTEREGWHDLTAVREGRAYALDGHRFMNRPGPRLVDSLEHLAGLVQPELFDAPPSDVARPLRPARAEL